MKSKPALLFIIDPKNEIAAQKEAVSMNVPVVCVANSDCDIDSIQYPIIANDSSVKSVRFFIEQIVDSIKEGQKERK